MCKFMSLTSDGKANIDLFYWEQRKQILRGELDYDADSHTSINDYHGYKGAAEDKRNKYEVNPLTGEFTIDQINTTDDSKEVEKIVKSLDFSTIIEPLIIKPIVHPFKLPKITQLTKEDIQLLKSWASVRASVGASVGDSVGASVWDSVGASVWASVGASVRASVGDSVGDSVWDSVGASVWAYTSSFFKIEKWQYIDHEPYNNPYQPLISLWEKGLVPSYDGTMWRLHSGTNADIVFCETNLNLEQISPMNIKEQRKKYNRTQIDIAVAIGVTEQTIRNWEKGATKPSADNEEKLRKYFENLE